ncbi:hypothetical protein ACM66B_005567 [Microbotryomycetes sp. NB124-2]
MGYKKLGKPRRKRQRQGRDKFSTVPADVQLLILETLLDEATVSASHAIMIEQTLHALSLCGSRAWHESVQHALYRRPMSGCYAKLSRIQALVHTVSQKPELGALVQELPMLGDWLMTLHYPLNSWDEEEEETSSADESDLTAEEATALGVTLLEHCPNLLQVNLPVPKEPCFLPDLTQVLSQSVQAMTFSGQGFWNCWHLEQIFKAVNGRALKVLKFDDFDFIDDSIPELDDDSLPPIVPPPTEEAVAHFTLAEPSFSIQRLELVDSLQSFRPVLERIINASSIKPTEVIVSYNSEELEYLESASAIESNEFSLGFIGWLLKHANDAIMNFTFDTSHGPIQEWEDESSSFSYNVKDVPTESESAGWHSLSEPNHHSKLTSWEYESFSKDAEGGYNRYGEPQFLQQHTLISELPFGALDIDLPSLTKLQLFCCQGLTIDIVRNILAHCPSLTYVSLRNSVWEFEYESCGNFQDPDPEWEQELDLRPLRSDFVDLIHFVGQTQVKYMHLGTLPLTDKQRARRDVGIMFGAAATQAGVQVEFGTCVATGDEEDLSDEEKEGGEDESYCD